MIKTLIYCCHKYGGKEENKIEAECKIKALQANDLDNTYISPIHALGFMYNSISYDDGMELCYDLLSVCDKVIVLSDMSEGIKREVALAEKLGIEVVYYAKKEAYLCVTIKKKRRNYMTKDLV